MRKLNALLTIAIFVLFLLHGIFGGFELFGVGGTALKTLAWAAVILIAVHTLIGIKLTIDTLKTTKKTGASYFRENKLFWARRISGFAVMLFLIVHIFSFGYTAEGGVYRLRPFGGFSLTAALLLAVSVAVHILTNIRPLMIALGVKNGRKWVCDILFVLSVLILFMAAAFIVYYFRWNVF